jgi:ATP-dependent helicase YprA (DUF1998 family)/very-short-patch-repair endonuclease
MKIFDFRNRLIEDYSSYVKSFIEIRDTRIREYVERTLDDGHLWPDPLIQMNPSFEPGAWIDDLVKEGVLHAECSKVFRKGKEKDPNGQPLHLHKHQSDAVRVAKTNKSYVLTTGTGSGKSLAYIVPIVDHVLRRGSGKGIQAIIVYPMNALANSQAGELEKFLAKGYPDGKPPVRFARYTGQENDDEKQEIVANPPDILLTNYVMLELILTRTNERQLVDAAKGLRFLVLDELHTYRGRQGADVALLVRRVRDRVAAPDLQCVGTSATLASGGSQDEQRAEVARVASLFFGSDVSPESIIGETLQRTTPGRDITDAKFVDELRSRVADADRQPPDEFDAFRADPLSIWLESTFGVTTEAESGRLIRVRTPRSVTGKAGAAAELAALTGLDVSRCADAIEDGLLAGYGSRHPETGFPAFAFRLHQFISRGDTVYASLENEADRTITVYGQQFVPDSNRTRALLPVVFCRECGQEYYCVRERRDSSGNTIYEGRDIGDRFEDESSDPGFLYARTDEPWPDDLESILDRVPEDWVEEKKGQRRIKSGQKQNLPKPVRINATANESSDGRTMHFVPAPFRFCLSCGVAYGGRQSSDFAKLGSLGSEGRSTATTILSLSTIRHLRIEDLPAHARKLLSFTDNRQDASLQAGHFNDFIEVGILRSALHKAVKLAGAEGISHEQLTAKVFEALALPLQYYAVDSTVRFQALEDTKKALRQVLGYRLYRDLKRGWRITSPNLEQAGLLAIEYGSLSDIAQAEDVWASTHASLASASPLVRQAIAKTLLDYMRRELAIKVDFLDRGFQEQLQQLSNQRLKAPWAIDENEYEAMEHAAVLFPRSVAKDDERGNVFLSARGGFGQYLRRSSTWDERATRPANVKETEIVIRELLEALRQAGLVEIIVEPKKDGEAPGYQLPASAIRWTAGDGTRGFHDPIRVPKAPPEGRKTNTFFRHFYETIAEDGLGLEAREHTAQVPSDTREKRENAFREGALPILYCSPTMELGVDISELNVVSLRNIPPTPANYAQRSGRAGRSGQPALVFSYCAFGSPHDQYFFKRPEKMVAGAVSPPRLDLTNEDMVRAHIQAVWLAETGASLGKSLQGVLDLAGEEPSLRLQDGIVTDLSSDAAKTRAKKRAIDILGSLGDDLSKSGWYSSEWLDRTLEHALREFDAACERWRTLYRAAHEQAIVQAKVVRDATRSEEDKRQAKRLRAEAEAQLHLLTKVEELAQSDFFSYRYFASEGFLPGYSFPRLPLSAFIPGRKSRQDDEFLSRPRFLAISEFGPRAIIYHEGSRYIINKVILPVGEEQELQERSAKICGHCGYLHPIGDGAGADVCDNCQGQLEVPWHNLLRLQNVSTKRREKINSDEEERLRLGYELRTSVRFSEHGGGANTTATVEHDGDVAFRLAYGQAATLWRINLGWNRRKDRDVRGFILDKERGYWAKNEILEEGEQEDPMSPQKVRVVPFVEDHRNCLLIQPTQPLDERVMASLQAALKNAIQVHFQLEGMELAAEPLPTSADRRQLLIYEAAEGGAGALRRLVEDPTTLAAVARTALEVCHFTPTGEDLGKAPRSQDRCEAACYDCLLSYSNQPDHRRLDRFAIRDVLLSLATSVVNASPVRASRSEHLEKLMRLAGSGLERTWLRHLDARRHRLPSDAQKLLETFGTRPDFLYDGQQTVIYIDGPHHKYPERVARDQQLTERLEDAGYSVIRFAAEDDWDAILAKFPDIFGASSVSASGTRATAPRRFDADLFPDAWQETLAGLAGDGLIIEPGEDVVAGDRVVGTFVAKFTRGTNAIYLVDPSDPDAARVTSTLGKAGLRVITSDPGGLGALVAQELPRSA